MPIRWEELDSGKYEDMISVLVSRLFPRAQRIDGSGGDGGRDVQIVPGENDAALDAFELKSFTGRMTDPRRKQVRNSLKKAAKLNPGQWMLVVPIDPTPGELRWFHEMGKEYSFPIIWHGKTWLDDKMAAYSDIRRYFLEGASDEVFRLLKEIREEQARVTDIQGAIRRARALRAQLNEIDPYYRYELSPSGSGDGSLPPQVALSVDYGDIRVDVFPKYLGATVDRPIPISVNLILDPSDNSVLDAFKYGLSVTVPPEMVGGVTIDAPLGLGVNLTEAEVSILPTSTTLDEPVILPLDIVNDNAVIASWPTKITKGTKGYTGYAFSASDSTGWLQAFLRLDVGTRKIEATFSLNPKPVMPSALLPLLKWVNAFKPPHSLVLNLPGGFEAHNEIPTPLFGDERLSEYVGGLAYLQDRSGIHWEVPPALILERGHNFLTAATLLKGEAVEFSWTSLHFGLDHWGPRLDQLLRGESHQFIMDNDSWIEVEGRHIPIGRTRTTFESVRLENAEAVKEALASGPVSHLRLVPGDSDKARRVVIFPNLTQALGA